MGRILEDHLNYSRNKLLEYSKHLDLPNQGDIKGSAREGLVNIFLQNNLPRSVDYGSGEIVDESDERSGQVDIVIQSSFSPKMNLFGALNLSFNDSVLAAIEVKSNLTTSADWEKSSHLKMALKSSEKIKSLKRRHLISGRILNGETITLPNTPTFIFAYSGPTSDTLIEKLKDFGTCFGLQQEDYWPEVITVLDRGYYIIKNDGWLIGRFDPKFNCSKNESESGCLVGMFAYLCKIIEAWHGIKNPTQFQEYFKNL